MMPVYVKNENVWVQIMPSILGAAFLLLTLFFNTQILNTLKASVSPDQLMHRFQHSRSEEVRAAERGSVVLRQAADMVAKSSINIPREAAICLLARKLSDETINEAMRPGRDFSVELDAWNAEARAADIFCAYAMRVGVVK